MNLVILNYSGNTVSFYTIPLSVDSDEKIQDWIVNETEHRLSDIHYMVSIEEIEIIHQ